METLFVYAQPYRKIQKGATVSQMWLFAPISPIINWSEFVNEKCVSCVLFFNLNIETADENQHFPFRLGNNQLNDSQFLHSRKWMHGWASAKILFNDSSLARNIIWTTCINITFIKMWTLERSLVSSPFSTFVTTMLEDQHSRILVGF